MARGPAVELILTDRERSELEMRVRRRKIARSDAVRAEIVLLAADGLNNSAKADELGDFPADGWTVAKAVCQKAF